VLKLTFTGYIPSQIVKSGWIQKLVQQAWETGEIRLTLIQGHGPTVDISPGLVVRGPL